MNGATGNYANPGSVTNIMWTTLEGNKVAATLFPGFLNERPVTQLPGKSLPILVFNAWNPNSVTQTQAKQIIDSKRFVYFVLFEDKIQEVYIHSVKFGEIARTYPNTDLDVCYKASDEADDNQSLEPIKYDPKIEGHNEASYNDMISNYFFRDQGIADAKKQNHEKTPLNKKEEKNRECCSVQ